MISQALQFVTAYLNEQFKVQLDVTDNSVIASSITNLDGSIVAGLENKLVVSIINIGHEKIMRSPPNHTANHNTRAVSLNIYVLVTANYQASNYKEGLNKLSNVIEAFEKTPVFDTQRFPAMKPPLTKLTLELHTTSMEEMGAMWTAIGVNQRPSILYKVRLAGLQKDKESSLITGIKGDTATF